MGRFAMGWVVALAGLAGCGRSNSSAATCENLANALNELSSKYASCGSITSGALNFDTNGCQQAFDNSGCSDDDRQKINDYADCLGDLPSCTPATQNDWVTSLTRCEARLLGISSKC